MRCFVRVLAGLAFVTGALFFGVSSAKADAPEGAGWWTSLNPGSVLGTPTPPPPPDVPARGLLIEGGGSASNPTAIAAVVYQLPPRAIVGELTLTVAPNSVATPAAKLALCPLSNPAVIPEYGGPMADAPTYKCQPKLTVSSSDGKQYRFNVARLVADDSLAVAILPTSPTDRIVLAPPEENSLAVDQAAPTHTADNQSGETGDHTQPSSGTAGAPDTPDSRPGGILQNVTGPPTDSPRPTTSPTPQVSIPPAAVPVEASSFDPASSHRRPAAVAIAIISIVIGGGMWEAAGRAATRGALETKEAP